MSRSNGRGGIEELFKDTEIIRLDSENRDEVCEMMKEVISPPSDLVIEQYGALPCGALHLANGDSRRYRFRDVNPTWDDDIVLSLYDLESGRQESFVMRSSWPVEVWLDRDGLYVRQGTVEGLFPAVEHLFIPVEERRGRKGGSSMKREGLRYSDHDIRFRTSPMY